MKREVSRGIRYVESPVSRFILNPCRHWNLRNPVPVKRIQQSAPVSTVPVVQPPTPIPPLVVQPPLSPAPGSVELDPLDSDDYYPYADGVPFASNPEQGQVMMEVRHALGNYFETQRKVYIGMDMLVYDKRGDRTSCLAPDVFVTFDVAKPVGRSYKIWLVGKPPDIVWEFASASTAKEDAGTKKQRYRGWGVPEYWLYDPQGGLHKPRLQGFRLVKGRYRRLPEERRNDSLLVVTSPLLGLELHSDRRGLRFWDPEAGDYLKTGGESEKERLVEQAEKLEERAGRLEERAGRLEEREKRLQLENRVEAEAQARRESEDRATAAEDRAKAAEARAAELDALVAKLTAPDSVSRKQK